MGALIFFLGVVTVCLVGDTATASNGQTSPPVYIYTDSVTAYSIRLLWLVPSNARHNRTTYRIGLRNGSASNTESFVVVNNSKGYYTFKNLHPYTYYYFRVQRGVIGGTFGSFSRSIWMDTLEDRPTAPPTNVTAYSTSSLSIQVHWAQIPTQHRNGHILGYRICYYKTTDPPKSRLCYSTYALSNHLGSVEPYTPYYITVLGYTNIGDGPGCTPLLVWTDQFVPSRAPELVSLASTTTTISIQWRHIPQQFVHGILLGYTLVCSEAANPKNRQVFRRINATATSLQITDLNQNTMYGVKIAGLTRVRGLIRNGKISPIWNITTMPGCDPPPNVKANSPCPQCMTVQWDKVIASSAVKIVGYNVTLKSPDSHDVIKDVAVGELRTNVTNLKPFTTYSIRVAAKTERGLGRFSQQISQTTLESVPSSAPKHVTVKSMGPQSIMVSWSPLSHKDTNGVLQGYYVYYKQIVNRFKRSPSTGVVHVSNFSASSAEIKGLQPFSLYRIEVAGFTKKGGGPKSAPVTVRTDEEVPSRSPERITAKALNSHALVVTWQPLSRQYTNGILKGYHVYYRKKTANTSVIRNVVTVNASALDVTIKGLEPNTEYEIWIEAFTAKGSGPGSDKVTATTLKIIPGQPQDVQVEFISPRSVKVTWHSPDPIVSRVTGYMVKWTKRGDLGGSAVDNQKIVKVSGSYYRRTTVTGLLPYSMYTFTVREQFDGKWGVFSAPVDQMMPEDAPSPPLDLSVDKKDRTTLVLSWRKPESANGVIRKYVLYFANTEMTPLWEDTVNEGIAADSIKHTFILPDKTAKYRITVQAFNSLPGQKSDVITVHHVSSVDTVGYAKKGDGGIKLPWLIFIISAIALFLLGVLVFFLIWKFRQKKPKPTHEEEIIAMIPKSVGARRPIPVSQLKQHCDRYHAYDDALFTEEFKTLNHIPLRATFEASQASFNKNKNRYPNILPYDHSRVGLKVRKDSPTGYDYINASFIDGYGCQRKYIATQGPLRDTINDFWRMVWEKNCTTIVMLGDDENNLKLHSDCERYWPEHGYQEYGDLAVSLVEETQMTDWAVRTFLVWSTDPECMDKREITQYQYTAWPDQGVPDNTASLIIFQHKLRMGVPLDLGPIVVHCGAGVGRTGTFIAIDSLLDQRLMEGVVDMYGFVAQMRTQRNYMVQTEDQYAFIHDVLRDVCICGITEVNSQDLGSRLLVMSDTDLETLRRRNDEFDKLPVWDHDHFKHGVSMIRENIVKNRCPDVLPFDRNRVRVTASSDTANSDYINASYIDGYNEGHAYIATQAPMENTVLEFWQMVWEQKCTAIVMLTELTDRAGHGECVQYWPMEGCLRYGKYIVTKIDEEALDDHTQRVFKLRCHGSMDSLLVYHFQYHNWYHDDLPPRVNGLVCLHENVQKIQLAEDHGPTIVHCSDGASRSGVYLTFALCIDRLEAEDNVDVFQTVRWLRSQRPGLVGNAEQYNFCYQTVKSYLSWRIRTTNDYVTA